jgi:hypothetical protein
MLPLLPTGYHLTNNYSTYDDGYLTFSTELVHQNYFTTCGLPPISSFCRQSLETHDQSFFAIEPLGQYFLCNILSYERLCLSFLHRLGLSQVYVWHIYHVIATSSNIYRSYVSPGFWKQIMPISLISCYNGGLVTWTVISFTTAKFKPLLFSMSAFALSYAANMFILVILYDFCLLPV